MQIDKRRGRRLREQRRLLLFHPGAGKTLRGSGAGGLQRCARPVDHGDRRRAHDLLPAPPAMELQEIIRPHDPDELHARAAPVQEAQRIGGVARANLRLEPHDDDARIARDLARRRNARGERGQSVRIFQRIAGRDEPPQPIEPQPRERNAGNKRVAFVRRIERAAEEADAHARSVGREADRGGDHPADMRRRNGLDQECRRMGD